MSNKLKIGIDWDGVGSEGIIPEGSFIILTGRPEEDHDEIIEALGDLKASQILHFPDQEELDETNKNIKIGIWKAKTIKKLGIEKFYEDTPEQIDIIKELNPTLEIISVLDGIPQVPMNFIVFTFDGTILPVAKKLEEEGNRVIVGIIQDKRDILLPDEEYSPEDLEKKVKRLSLYDGVIDKFPAHKVLKVISKIKNKEDWIVLTDSNSNYNFTEKALELGFTKGIFPTQKDRSMEVNRNEAKEFVKEHYPDIKVAEVKTFKTIEEGIQFINESEDIWVLKSLGDDGETIVPDCEDEEACDLQLIAALEEMKSEYESHGYILEQKIQEVTELTPEIMFWDGVPVCVSLDIENKGIGAANTGIQTGCMQNLICRTDFEDRINKIAFPAIVHEMAKERKGLFVWDLSILIDKEDNLFFGEYCSQRFGWDCFPTELAMASNENNSKTATPFFAALINKKNPFRKQFGAGVRILNIGRGGKMIEDGVIECTGKAEQDTFLYEVKKNKEGKYVSTNCGFDFAVVTSASDDKHECIEECYEKLDTVLFEGKYFRPKFDFCSYEYHTSIMRRYDYAIMSGLISDGSNLAETKIEK